MAKEVVLFLFLSFLMLTFAGFFGIIYTLGSLKRLPKLTYLSYFFALLHLGCTLYLTTLKILSPPWKFFILFCGFSYALLPPFWIKFVKNFPHDLNSNRS